MGPFLRGLALDRLGKGREAIEAYEAALARDPKFLDAHKNLAILCHTRNPTYQDRARTEKAMAHYERYFALGGADAE
ncbi:MAG: tetratricopeptide repeat protein, partial [Planctomycetes bacterium]|nr:tetratricopeptide repeat protein [Planctomycetota bacterium]